MLIARLAAAAGALLVLGGCGTGYSAELEPSTTVTSVSPTTAAERSEYPTDYGTRKSIGEGVVLAIAPPETFTPSDTAYPRTAARAVAFDLELDNDSTLAFRPAELSFLATVDGRPTEQVIDSTQGYPAVAGTADKVGPGESLRFAVAFQVPDRDCAVRLSVRPDAASAAAVELYSGQA